MATTNPRLSRWSGRADQILEAEAASSRCVSQWLLRQPASDGHHQPEFEPLERPCRSRFFSLRLSMAAALRCRSPEARADTGILSANDIGQWTSCEVGLAPTCAKNEE